MLLSRITCISLTLLLITVANSQSRRRQRNRNAQGPTSIRNGGGFASGTVLFGDLFRRIGSGPSTSPPRPTTRPTTRSTTPTTPATPPPPSRPPPAPPRDAPPTNPLDTDVKVPSVPDRLKNVGQGNGRRPEQPVESVSGERPDSLEKTGHIKDKISTNSGSSRAADLASDGSAPKSNNDDTLQEKFFESDPISFLPPRNVPVSEQTPTKIASSLLGRSNVDGASDAPGTGHVASTYGLEFWVAFLDNRVETPMNKPLEIYVASGHYPSGVKATVKMWYYTPYGRKQEVYDVAELASDSVKIFTVPAFMKNVVNGIFKKGVRIVSDHPVSVYGFNYEPFSADAFRVLPVDVLSTHYIAVTYEQPEIRTQIACVALRDDTLVRVKLPKLPPIGTTEPVVDVEGLRYHAGENFNVTMSAFEVVAVRSVGDLTGTDITADDKIACFSGNVRAHVSVGNRGRSRDHLATQLLPVSTWGYEYAIAPSPSGSVGFSLGETHIMVSSKSNTRVTITESGKAPVTIVIKEANSKATIKNLDSFAHVISDKPILIAQVFGSQNGKNSPVTGDPSMMVYSSIDQYSHLPQTTLPPEGQFGYINRVLIFINAADTVGLRVSRKRNANVENRNWVHVPNTNLVGRYLNIGEDRLTQIYHVNSNVKFYVQYFGFSDRESYTYEGVSRLTLGCDHTPVIPGDRIDNDCDGKRDEELIDGYDNDGDGLVDEDTGYRHPYELVGGKEYLLAFMENSAEDFGQQIHLYMAVAPDSDAEFVDVTISQPLIPNGGIPTSSIRITKGRFHMVNLDPSTAVVYGTVVSNRAIKVVSTDRIVLYALNRKLFSMDGNLVLPLDRLGKEYYTVSYSPSHVGTQFAVVATEPDTQIEVVFPPEVTGKPWSDGKIQVPWAGLEWTNNHVLSIKLNQYETLQMQSGHNLPRDYQNRYERGDLTGTLIKSNKPVAVFSGNGRVNTRPSNSRDHLVEQLPPVASWGKEYIVTPTPGRTVGEYYRIIASEPNTKVIVDRSDGVYQTFVLGKGQFTQINIETGGVSASIYGDKPIMVVMFMKSQNGRANALIEPGDPAMIVIPHTYQWVYSLHFGTPLADYQDFFVTVILQKKYINGLRLDGQLINRNEFTITPRLGRKLFAYVIIKVNQGANYKLEHDNPFASFFAQIYGTRDRESVGYVLGVNIPILNKAYQYFPPPVQLPGAFGTSDFDIHTTELCHDKIDNDGDFLVDEDCEHAHEYYAMFMTNSVPDPMDHSLEIHCISTSNQNYVRFTTGHINRRLARHEVEKNVIREAILNRDESIMFTVPGYYRAQLSRSGYFDIQYKGVVVESDWALECFAFNKDTNSADGWLMKDYYDLGTMYVVSAAWPYSNHQLVGMVATEDDTQISITLPRATDPSLYYSYVDVQGYRYYAGETFNITLDRLQIFQLDVKSGFDLSGTFIKSSKPLAVFSGNERTGIPFEAYTGWDHAADQVPKIPTSVDLDPSRNGAYRYDAAPTPAANTADQYQCVGWSSDTIVTFKQNGITAATQPLGFMESMRVNLPSSGGAVQITANNPLMCEQFVWSDPARPRHAPELAGNILANTYYDSRPWFRFVIPKISTLSGFYNASLVVSFNLKQIFHNEAPAFFIDGFWVDNSVAPAVSGDQAYFIITDLKYGSHYISSAIVDLNSLTVKKALLRFTIQVHMHSGRESIAYSPVPERLYKA